MKFRWTMKELNESTDLEILRSLVAERKSELHPYTLFTMRLDKIHNKLTKKINKIRTNKRNREVILEDI